MFQTRCFSFFYRSYFKIIQHIRPNACMIWSSVFLRFQETHPNIRNFHFSKGTVLKILKFSLFKGKFVIFNLQRELYWIICSFHFPIELYWIYYFRNFHFAKGTQLNIASSRITRQFRWVLCEKLSKFLYFTRGRLRRSIFKCHWANTEVMPRGEPCNFET